MPVEYRDVTYVYSAGTPFETTALSAVSLTIREGGFLAVVGRTGSGKSTLIQLMNGLLSPTSGSVIVDGADLATRRLDMKAIRAKVGLVFQYPEHQLFEETVAADVAFGPRCLGVPPDEIAQRVAESCEAVGMPVAKFGKRSPFELSGGEMRRVAIAGVLAMRPKYLVMDEPTAGLDPKGRSGMLALLKNLHASGITICMVSHSMEEVVEVARDVIVLDKGHIAIEGAASDVFSQYDKLAACGLEPPASVRLLTRLRTAGIDIGLQLTSPDEIADAICRVLERRCDV